MEYQCNQCLKALETAKNNMYTLEVYYSVQNGGDGSAYPHLFESIELADWDQEHMYEGWGENCSGTFRFESESPITCLEEITTKEHILLTLCLNDDRNLKEFIKQFFPLGLNGKFEIREVKVKKFHYYEAYFNDKKLDFVFSSMSVKELEDKLNNVCNELKK